MTSTSRLDFLSNKSYVIDENLEAPFTIDNLPLSPNADPDHDFYEKAPAQCHKMKMLMVSFKSRQIVGNGPSFCRKLPSGAMAIPIWIDINLEQHKRGHEMCNFN